MQLSLGLAFLAGVISFISPCVLALVPVYLAYLGETAATVGVQRLEGRSGLATAVAQPVFGQAALFCLAFGAVFVTIGVSAGLLGTQLFRLPLVRETAGLVVVALGLLMTGLFGPVLARFRLAISIDRLPAGRSTRSLALGAIFSLGWSPCIGPVLGAILTLGASSQDAWLAALLLAFYSAGLAAPFLLAALALPQMTPLIAALRRRHRAVEVIAGLFIIAMGVLVYFNAFGRMAALFNFLFI